MNYIDMVTKVQEHSGLSKAESEHGLKTFIRTLSSRLTPNDRTNFVSELPQELQTEATSINTDETSSMADIVETIARTEHVDTNRAKQLCTASWSTLKESLTPRGIDALRSGLPRDVMGQLT
jgi:uncharacterized protein (DUF2267 family)